jgi:hypothetical protein
MTTTKIKVDYTTFSDGREYREFETIGIDCVSMASVPGLLIHSGWVFPDVGTARIVEIQNGGKPRILSAAETSSVIREATRREQSQEGASRHYSQILLERAE